MALLNYIATIIVDLQLMSLYNKGWNITATFPYFCIVSYNKEWNTILKYWICSYNSNEIEL